jgi:probable addiction module antidote protein
MKTTRKEKWPDRPVSLDYREDLIHRLREDPEYARGYLGACLEEGHGAFQVALRDVIDAFGGMTKVSRKTGLNRETLYRTLSRRGNPRQDTLEKVLGALGLGLSVVERPPQGKKRKAAGGRSAG